MARQAAGIDASRDLVISRLERMGLAATAIPESGAVGVQSPDIKLTVDGQIVLIEVKTKHDADGYASAIAAELERDGKVVLSDPLRWTRALDREAMAAAKQLAAHEDSTNGLRLLWVTVDAVDADDQFWFWRYTLYGIGCVLDRDGPALPPLADGSILDMIAVRREAVECDYFHESSFWKLRTMLDGVVLATGEDLVLLANDHSDRAEQLMSSTFTKKVPGSIIHPRLNPGPLAPRYLADCDSDRRDTGATLSYLAKKYGLGSPMVMEMQRHLAFVRTS